MDSADGSHDLAFLMGNSNLVLYQSVSLLRKSSKPPLLSMHGLGIPFGNGYHLQTLSKEDFIIVWKVTVAPKVAMIRLQLEVYRSSSPM